MAMILKNVGRIRESIAEVCHKVGRSPSEIILVGVTKYVSETEIAALLEAGVSHIAENKVQDAVRKLSQLDAQSSVIKHLIGPLQSNKSRLAVQTFDLIQTVDRLKILQYLSRHAVELDQDVAILFQVNTSREAQKFGCRPDELWALMDEALRLPRVQVQGLMTIAALSADEMVVRNSFKELKSLFNEAKTRYQAQPQITMKYLSMGMSQDFKLAIEEGANMIRIGSALFQNI